MARPYSEVIMGIDPVTGAMISKRVKRGQRVIAFVQHDEQDPGLFFAVRGTLEEARARINHSTAATGHMVGYVFPGIPQARDRRWRRPSLRQR